MDTVGLRICPTSPRSEVESPNTLELIRGRGGIRRRHSDRTWSTRDSQEDKVNQVTGTGPDEGHGKGIYRETEGPTPCNGGL